MYDLRLKHISSRYQNILKWVTRKGIIKLRTEILIPFREGIERVSDCDTFSERYYQEAQTESNPLGDAENQGMKPLDYTRRFFCLTWACVQSCVKNACFLMIAKALWEESKFRAKIATSPFTGKDTTVPCQIFVSMSWGLSLDTVSFSAKSKGVCFLSKIVPHQRVSKGARHPKRLFVLKARSKRSRQPRVRFRPKPFAPSNTPKPRGLFNPLNHWKSFRKQTWAPMFGKKQTTCKEGHMYTVPRVGPHDKDKKVWEYSDNSFPHNTTRWVFSFPRQRNTDIFAHEKKNSAISLFPPQFPFLSTIPISPPQYSFHSTIIFSSTIPLPAHPPRHKCLFN